MGRDDSLIPPTANNYAVHVFTKDELRLFRQWFNSLEDVNPRYLEADDRALHDKIMVYLYGDP
jgi:uncharacterized protein YjaZ